MPTTDVITVITTCPLCGSINEVTAPEHAVFAWALCGVRVQDALPMLTPDEREMLVTGIDPTCWEQRFGGAE